MKLYKDPDTGLWMYRDKVVCMADKQSLFVDLEGARGELVRWNRAIQNIQNALAQIENEQLEKDVPDR
jgi:phage terminase Nu1 subunit (DNA packaging protein)